MTAATALEDRIVTHLLAFKLTVAAEELISRLVQADQGAAFATNLEVLELESWGGIGPRSDECQALEQRAVPPSPCVAPSLGPRDLPVRSTGDVAPEKGCRRSPWGQRGCSACATHHAEHVEAYPYPAEGGQRHMPELLLDREHGHARDGEVGGVGVSHRVQVNTSPDAGPSSQPARPS